MPTYCFKCKQCGNHTEEIRHMSEAGNPQLCECGNKMGRDYGSEGAIDSGRDYSTPLVSNSLAVSMSQIEEHKRAFPDVQITNEGQPVFHGFKQHDGYLKKTGFIKHPKKSKKASKKIA